MSDYEESYSKSDNSDIDELFESNPNNFNNSNSKISQMGQLVSAINLGRNCRLKKSIISRPKECLSFESEYFRNLDDFKSFDGVIEAVSGKDHSNKEGNRSDFLDEIVNKCLDDINHVSVDVDGNIIDKNNGVKPTKDLELAGSPSHDLFSRRKNNLNRLKNLNKADSIFGDNNPEDQTSRVMEGLDSDFQMKLTNIYQLDQNTMNKPSKLTHSLSGEINNYRASSENCEIVEENLSPVSQTKKLLEHQLSMPCYNVPQAYSPRIPKISRFGRLSRLVNIETESNEVQRENEKA